VTITDANGCTITASYTITEPTAITTTLVGTNVSCFGASNGAIDLTVGGGTAPYTFLWSTFQSIEDLSNISGGTYFVIVTDANGCIKRDSIVITEAPALVLTTTVTNVTCNGAATGAVDLTVTGGLSPYDYSWSNAAITQDLTGVTAGTYTVTVKDASNCSATASATITAPTAIVLNSSVVNVACANGADGAVDITVQGGAFPYTYLWSNNAVTEDINNVSGGTYTVTITDANGCSLTASFTITEPNGMTSSIVGTDVTCNGANNGAADLTVTGGTTPYNFLWSTFQGTEDISGLDGGLYYVIITDANGCEIKDSVFIAEPLPIVLTTVVTNISCFNANDGVIDLSVTGGTPNYTYLWSNNAATQDVSSLPGGQYVVTVTDAQNCTATASVTIVNPSAINANFITKNPLCNGDTSGRIDLLVSGGTPAYNFSWSNGAVTEDLVNVGAGTYIVTITDSRNCNHVDSATIVEPGQIFTSGVVKNVSCNGLADGFVDITAYAGTLPYTYKWSTLQSTEDIFNVPGGDYYVTVTDINGCEAVSLYIIKEPLPLGIGIAKTDVRCYGQATGTLAVLPTGGTTPYYYLWNNFATDSLLLGVEAGHYTIQLTDSNGCFIYDSVDVNQPTDINIAATLINAQCYGAADAGINVTTTGGTPSYSFNWSNNANTEDLVGVVAGTYTLTVTDGNICQKTATFTVGEGPQIISSLAALDPICNGGNTGSITAITSGGVQPYTYAWSNSKTSVAIGTLVAGTYTLTITDAANCTVTSSAVLNDPAAINVSANAQGAKCFNTASGQVTAFVTGGFAPYNYMLNGVAQSNDTFTNLLPGQYLLLVTDVNGCSGSASFSVSSPSDISVDLNVTEQVILTGMQTQLIATATSDTTILNYFWSPDSIGSSIFDYSGCGDPLNCSNPKVAPRTTTVFTVTVMNADSCYASDTVTVYVDNELSAFIPTAFTPNGDGLNDRFEFDILGATNVEVSVFNRWGQRIYYNPSQTNKMNVGNDGWDGTVDGKLAPFDTYVYQIKVRYMQDYVLSEKDFTGTVTLMK
ncbi:MAG TPA: T9SS type B sorting domain-containing protein, partial [Chitinophagales bacterium]|nr:T9SS type B sorting domain-containing protein [Chitinophagales bacterium]